MSEIFHREYHVFFHSYPQFYSQNSRSLCITVDNLPENTKNPSSYPHSIVDIPKGFSLISHRYSKNAKSVEKNNPPEKCKAGKSRGKHDTVPGELRVAVHLLRHGKACYRAG